jgi:hypothetical protein
LPKSAATVLTREKDGFAKNVEIWLALNVNRIKRELF